MYKVHVLFSLARGLSIHWCIHILCKHVTYRLGGDGRNRGKGNMLLQAGYPLPLKLSTCRLTKGQKSHTKIKNKSKILKKNKGVADTAKH